MSAPAGEIAVDQDLARRLIATAFPQLPLQRLTHFGEGFDNVLWLADDTLLFRFPRRQAAIAGVERELALLPLIAPLLPVAIPQPDLQAPAGAVEGYPWPFSGGPLLAGRESSEAELDDGARCELARPLGLTLRALHSPEVAAAVAAAGHSLPADPMGRGDMGTRVRRAREALGDVQRLGMWAPDLFVLDLLNGARSLAVPPATCVSHGDLHFRHLLIDAQGGLSGIIDWGDLCLASPAVDLQLIWSFLPAKARPPFGAAYGPIGQANLLRARVLALNLNAVLAIYGRKMGLGAVEREAVASLKRAATD